MNGMPVRRVDQALGLGVVAFLAVAAGVNARPLPWRFSEDARGELHITLTLPCKRGIDFYTFEILERSGPNVIPGIPSEHHVVGDECLVRAHVVPDSIETSSFKIKLVVTRKLGRRQDFTTSTITVDPEPVETGEAREAARKAEEDIAERIREETARVARLAAELEAKMAAERQEEAERQAREEEAARREAVRRALVEEAARKAREEEAARRAQEEAEREAREEAFEEETGHEAPTVADLEAEREVPVAAGSTVRAVAREQAARSTEAPAGDTSRAEIRGETPAEANREAPEQEAERKTGEEASQQGQRAPPDPEPAPPRELEPAVEEPRGTPSAARGMSLGELLLYSLLAAALLLLIPSLAYTVAWHRWSVRREPAFRPVILEELADRSWRRRIECKTWKQIEIELTWEFRQREFLSEMPPKIQCLFQEKSLGILNPLAKSQAQELETLGPKQYIPMAVVKGIPLVFKLIEPDREAIDYDIEVDVEYRLDWKDVRKRKGSWGERKYLRFRPTPRRVARASRSGAGVGDSSSALKADLRSYLQTELQVLERWTKGEHEAVSRLEKKQDALARAFEALVQQFKSLQAVDRAPLKDDRLTARVESVERSLDGFERRLSELVAGVEAMSRASEGPAAGSNPTEPDRSAALRSRLEKLESKLFRMQDGASADAWTSSSPPPEAPEAGPEAEGSRRKSPALELPGGWETAFREAASSAPPASEDKRKARVFRLRQLGPK